jgi:hypothetical protein
MPVLLVSNENYRKSGPLLRGRCWGCIVEVMRERQKAGDIRGQRHRKEVSRRLATRKRDSPSNDTLKLRNQVRVRIASLLRVTWGRLSLLKGF